LSELIHEQGIALVGSLPPEIQAVTTFSGAVCAASTLPETAREFLSYLASSDTDPVKWRHGMEPAR